MRARARELQLAALCAVLAAGCGGARQAPPPPAIPVPAGRGPAYRPPSLTAAVAARRVIGRLRCSRRTKPRFGVHLELFAHRRLVLIPPGVGVAPPRRQSGAYVYGGACVYPLATSDPTGLVSVLTGTRATVGDFFDLWGQPLSAARLGAFAAAAGAPVRVYVDGRQRLGNPRFVPLSRHAEITLELGGYIPPHRSYRFPPGY